MNTYIWKIEQLDCTPSADGQNNVVSNIHWRVSATDGTNTTETYSAHELAFDAKNAFIAYSDLTKEQVIAWVQEAMGIDAVTRLQESLDSRLEMLASPPIITPPLPWSN
jgi:hypothetical protein